MVNYCSSALRYNYDVSAKLKNVIAPLFENLGFSHFAYNKFKTGHKFFSLAVDTESLVEFLSAEISLHPMFDKLYIKEGEFKLLLWENLPENPVLELLRRRGHYHGFSLYYRQGDQVEGWHFATDKEQPGIVKFHAQDLQCIFEFINYFRDKGSDFVDQTSYDNWVQFPAGMSMDLSHFELKDICENNKENFLNHISKKKYKFNIDGRVVYLTANQFSCLSYLSKGMSSKIIAKINNRSPRTVESAINNMKNTLNVHTKHELIKIYNDSIYAAMHQLI